MIKRSPVRLIFWWLGMAAGTFAATCPPDAKLFFEFDAFAWRDVSPAVTRDWDAPGGEAIRMQTRLERAEARRQDRWLEIDVALHPELSLPETLMSARLFAPGAKEPFAEQRVTPETHEARLLVDMRRHGLPRVRLMLELTDAGQRVGLWETFLSAVASGDDILEEVRIPLLLDVPPALAGHAASYPVTFGVPFPAGALWSMGRLRLVTADGEEIPAQKEVTGRWARDGAIQWVRFDALVQPGQTYVVEARHPAKAAATALEVTTSDAGIIMDTGGARYVIERKASPIAEVWQAGRKVASSAGTHGLFVEDQHGRVGRAQIHPDGVELESQGPVSAVVRCEGVYRAEDGAVMAGFIVRVAVYAGLPYADITHTLILTEDTRETWFRTIGWEWDVDVGAGPRATFSLDRDDARQVLVHEVEGDHAAFMLQESHVQLGSGSNRFVVAAGDQLLHEGETCGDWALLAGAAGGWLTACRDAARQHPKAFVAAPGRFLLELFSNRAGQELDFRPETLARQWGVDGAHKDEVLQWPDNAAGWAKTHQLLVAPVASGDEAAAIGAWHAHRVHALVAPEWTAASKALGALHPRDCERFFQAERLIDDILRRWAALAHEPGHYGFVNYYGGPTYSGPALRSGRYRSTYGIRPGAWLVYARSGDRLARDFAAGTNRSFMDNWITHADVPGKTRGVYLRHGGVHESYPFFWGGVSAFQIDSSTDLNQFLWDYHLTGYRRARDVVEQFAAGLKRAWRPDMHAWRKLMVFRVLTQAYQFTWDPELRALAEATLATVSDPESAVGLTKANRPYRSSTYKLGVDRRGFMEADRLHAVPRYSGLLSRLREALPGATWPVAYMHSFGVDGAYIYERWGDATVAAPLEFAIRRAATFYGRGTGASATSAVFEGLPYAMSVVARSGALERRPASWLAFQDYGYPTRVIAYKEDLETLELRLRLPWDGEDLGRIGGQVSVVPLGQTTPWGLDLNEVTERGVAHAHVLVPRDAPAGAYEIRYPARAGNQQFQGLFVMARHRAPLVLYAPGYWQLPDMDPPATVYFELPPQSEEARLFLEGPGRLFDPAGQPYGDPHGVRQWIRLPADRPGLWRLEPIENRLLRAYGFPPFFAMHEPDFHFIPPVEWESDMLPLPPDEHPESCSFGRIHPGPWQDPAARALRLGAGESLAVEPADGALPYAAGTIEFFFRPDWGTFDLGPGAVQCPLIRIITEHGEEDRPWGLTYRLDPEGTTILGGPTGPSHALYAWIYADSPRDWLPGRSHPYHVRAWLPQTIIERDTWNHLAYVWGSRPRHGARNEPLDLLTVETYLNGRGVQTTVFQVNHDGVLPRGAPQEVVLGPLDGSLAGVRISDIQRYDSDFIPPREPWLKDERTRALFLFNAESGDTGPFENGKLRASVRTEP